MKYNCDICNEGINATYPQQCEVCKKCFCSECASKPYYLKYNTLYRCSECHDQNYKKIIGTLMTDLSETQKERERLRLKYKDLRRNGLK